MNPLKVLNAITEIGWDILNEYYRPDCCIAATRIGIEVCDYFKIGAIPLTVRAQIFNPEYIKLFDELGHPETEEQQWEWRDKGAWICSIGDQDLNPLQPGKWPGHLVLIASSEHGTHLIDLTISQANRPQKNIEVSSVHFLIPPRFVIEESCFMVGCKGGLVVMYDSYPDNISFTHAPDWGKKREKRRNVVVGKIIRSIKKMDNNPLCFSQRLAQKRAFITRTISGTGISTRSAHLLLPQAHSANLCEKQSGLK